MYILYRCINVLFAILMWDIAKKTSHETVARGIQTFHAFQNYLLLLGSFQVK